MPEHANNLTSAAELAGTDGFEFVEIAVQHLDQLDTFLQQLGFRKTGLHRSKPVALYQQGSINLIINAAADNQARFVAADDSIALPAISAVALRVRDASTAYAKAISLGAWEADLPSRAGPMELNIPAIQGVGQTLLYFVDRYGERTIYDVDFNPLQSPEAATPGTSLGQVRCVQVSVEPGRASEWAGWFARLLGLEIEPCQTASGNGTFLVRDRGDKTRFTIASVGAAEQDAEGGLRAIVLAGDHAGLMQTSLAPAGEGPLLKAGDPLLITAPGGGFSILIEAGGERQAETGEGGQ